MNDTDPVAQTKTLKDGIDRMIGEVRIKSLTCNPSGPPVDLPNLDGEYRQYVSLAQHAKNHSLNPIWDEYRVWTNASVRFKYLLDEYSSKVDAINEYVRKLYADQRAFERAAIAERDWQVKNSAPLDDLCKKLIGEVDIIRRGINTAKTEVDLQNVRDALAGELHSMLKSIVVNMNK